MNKIKHCSHGVHQRQSSYLGIGLTDDAYVSRLDSRGEEVDN